LGNLLFAPTKPAKGILGGAAFLLLKQLKEASYD
jgi:hypothetical protein